MLWLELMRLDDGTRVESSIPARVGAYSVSGPWYRVTDADGATTEFSSMVSTLAHLHDRWDL
jgi:hypothetical protein